MATPSSPSDGANAARATEVLNENAEPQRSERVSEIAMESREAPSQSRVDDTDRPRSPSEPLEQDVHEERGIGLGLDKQSSLLYIPCELCENNAFSRVSDLERHLSTVHAAEHASKDYPCPVEGCSRKARAFKRKDHLTQHLRQYHFQDIPKKTLTTQGLSSHTWSGVVENDASDDSSLIMSQKQKTDISLPTNDVRGLTTPLDITDQQMFACPFYKREPRKWKSCSGPVLRSVDRVK